MNRKMVVSRGFVGNFGAHETEKHDVMGIFKKPSIKSLGKKKRDMPEGLWHKCPSCGAIIHEADLQQRFRVCSKCEHHFTLTSHERIELLIDPGTFKETEGHLESVNPLGFKSYTDKVKKLSAKDRFERSGFDWKRIDLWCPNYNRGDGFPFPWWEAWDLLLVKRLRGQSSSLRQRIGVWLCCLLLAVHGCTRGF